MLRIPSGYSIAISLPLNVPAGPFQYASDLYGLDNTMKVLTDILDGPCETDELADYVPDVHSKRRGVILALAAHSTFLLAIFLLVKAMNRHHYPM